MRAFEKVLEVGIALSAEKNLDKFFHLVLKTSQDIAGADASSLFLMKKNKLWSEYVINNTLNLKIDSPEHKPLELPSIPLDERYACAYVALKGTTLNISNVYQDEFFDFSGPKKFDHITGYRTQSMIVVPMLDLNNKTIGVIEVINAKDPVTGEIIPFSEEIPQIISFFASNAAVALQRSQMIENLEQKLLDIKTLKTSEDELNEKLRSAFADLEIKNKRLEEVIRKNKIIRYMASSTIILIIVGLWMFEKDFRINLEKVKIVMSSTEEKGEPAHKYSAKVKRGLISDSVTMTGILEPIEVIHITSPIDGINRID